MISVPPPPPPPRRRRYRHCRRHRRHRRLCRLEIEQRRWIRGNNTWLARRINLLGHLNKRTNIFCYT